jgi:HEAT repeat protein
MLKLNLSFAAVLMLTGFVAVQAENTPLTTKTEDQWIEVLKSDAKQKDKADACRELAVLGTAKSVPVLASMLADQTMNHMARYALETIPDPSVDQALRDALTKLKGKPLVGVVTSIGVRHDKTAIEALGKLLGDSDEFVTAAAARSLGQIGGADSAKTLKSAVATIPAPQLLPVYEGLFLCAKSFAESGKTAEAIAIYDDLRAVKEPQEVRAGGLRGAILVREKAGIPLMVEAFRGEDWGLADAAARAAIESKLPEVTAAVAGELGKGSADRQVLLAQVLGKRGDAAGLPALYTAAKSGEKAVRVAAIGAIAQIGNPASGSVLADLIGNEDKDVSKAAQQSLAAIQGGEVDVLIVKMLSAGDVPHRFAATELTGRRRMVSAVPDLVKAGADADGGVRASAMARVGELANPADFASLVVLLSGAKTSEDLEVAAQALSAVCSRSTTPEAVVTVLLEKKASLQPAQQGALLQVLATAGGAKALASVHDALGQADLHAAAVRALAEWKSLDATTDLLQVAKTTTVVAERASAFESYLRLCNESDAAPAQRLKLIGDIAAIAKDTHEKVLALSSMGGVPTVESMKLAAGYLAEADLADEAATAILRITHKLNGSNKADMTPVFGQILKSAKSKKVLDDTRAQMKKFKIAE